MSQSPTQASKNPDKGYLDAWSSLAARIREGNSFSGREPNSCFLNTRGPQFADVSQASGFGLPDDARALARVDWDQDGDLDIWVTNRNGPRLRFLRNDMPGKYPSLALHLQGDPAKRVNRDGIGAKVEVSRKDKTRISKTLTAGDGFLSQSSKWLHFGLGESAVESVSVRWPGQSQSEIFSGIGTGGRFRLVQGTGRAELAKATARNLAINDQPIAPPNLSSAAHIPLVKPRPVVVAPYESWDGAPVTIESGKSTLLVFWAAWCQPCQTELRELAKRKAEITAKGLLPIALNIEGLDDGKKPASAESQAVLRKLGWTFASGRATAALLEGLDKLRPEFLYKVEPLPLPASFLLHRGQLISLDQGPANLQAILQDLGRLDKPFPAHFDFALPFSGRWSNDHFVTNPVAIAQNYLEGGFPQDARQYLQESLAKLEDKDPTRRRMRESDLQFMLGECVRLEQGSPAEAIALYQKAVELNQDHPMAAMNLAIALRAAGRGKEIPSILGPFAQRNPGRVDVRQSLGQALLDLGKAQEARVELEAVFQQQPGNLDAITDLCWLYATSGEANPARAEELAKTLAQSNKSNPFVLDSIAAAMAAKGDFAQASKVIGQAIAGSRGNAVLAKRLAARLAAYKEGKIYRGER